ITLRIPLFQAKEMTLPQQNTASARPTSFYYLMCQLDRVQYLKTVVFFIFKSFKSMVQQVTKNGKDKKSSYPYRIS
ncbi:hypothetical protein, partial [Limosilactobacillus fermentum]|uniref:hypothetical protein n=1 Tax=Limosilactobacillus fermentum TaxID=1613 RepID=UPI001EDD6D9D